MFKSIIAISLLLAISACNPSSVDPQLIQSKPVVYLPNDTFFYCPTVKQLPDVATLSDEQVAVLLINLSKNNSICHASMVALKAELIKAKNRFGK